MQVKFLRDEEWMIKVKQQLILRFDYSSTALVPAVFTSDMFRLGIPYTHIASNCRLNESGFVQQTVCLIVTKSELIDWIERKTKSKRRTWDSIELLHSDWSINLKMIMTLYELNWLDCLCEYENKTKTNKKRFDLSLMDDKDSKVENAVAKDWKLNDWLFLDE